MNQRLTAVVLALVTGACAGKVDKGVLANVRKLGVLTVTTDQLGAQPSDAEIMRGVAGRALDTYAKELAKTQKWQLVMPSQYKSAPDYVGFANLATSGVVRGELEKMAASGELKPTNISDALAYSKAQMTGDQAEKQRIVAASVGPAQQQFAELVGKKAAAYVAGDGVCVVPYSVLKPEGGSNTTTIKMGNAQKKSPEETMRDLMYKSIGALAEKLGLDALAVVYVHAQIKATIGIGLITGDRGRDSLKMASTVMVIDKEGRKAIDLGYPGIDDLAHSKMALPVYKIVYSDKGQHVHPSNKRRFDYVVDLKDPEGKVAPAADELVTEVAGVMSSDLASALKD